MAIVGSGWIKSVRQCCPTPFNRSTESVSLGSRMTTKGHLACGHEAVTSGSYSLHTNLSPAARHPPHLHACRTRGTTSAPKRSRSR